MRKNLLLIGKILGGFVSGCIVTFAIVLCLTTFLGLTGCSMNVAPQLMMGEQQNKIEWVVTDAESRAVRSLDSVTLEIYRVPVREHKYIKDEMELTEVRTLQRGERFSVPSAKDYKYEFATYVRCIEFNNDSTFYDVRNEINFFDYEGDIVMEIVQYRGRSLKHIEEEDGWTIKGGVIYYRGEQEGYTNQYVFLNKNSEAMSRFYGEHKYGGRIEWNN